MGLELIGIIGIMGGIGGGFLRKCEFRAGNLVYFLSGSGVSDLDVCFADGKQGRML